MDALENIDFSDNIGRYLYILEYALPIPPLGYCFCSVEMCK